jgi:GntR family transcriptional regulator, carbon starvation induced regulator
MFHTLYMSNGNPGPLSRTDWVVRELREAIASGELPAGTRLSAPELATQWNVSATPVREAFQRLVADGFLEGTSHRGVRVASMSAEELQELYELRVLVEPAALVRALQHADEAWHRRVRETFERLRAVAATGPADAKEYEDAHRAWHYALVADSGPTWWPRVVKQLRDNSERYHAMGLKRRGIDEVMREHERIQAAVIKGDAERAADQLRKHLARTELAVRQALTQTPSTDGDTRS